MIDVGPISELFSAVAPFSDERRLVAAGEASAAGRSDHPPTPLDLAHRQGALSVRARNAEICGWRLFSSTIRSISAFLETIAPRASMSAISTS